MCPTPGEIRAIKFTRVGPCILPFSVGLATSAMASLNPRASARAREKSTRTDNKKSIFRAIGRSSSGSPEVKLSMWLKSRTSKSPFPSIINRLRRTSAHLASVVHMIENERECQELSNNFKPWRRPSRTPKGCLYPRLRGQALCACASYRRATTRPTSSAWSASSGAPSGWPTGAKRCSTTAWVSRLRGGSE